MELQGAPWGLKLAQKIFRENGTFKKKKVVAVYIEGNTIIADCNSKKTCPEAAWRGYMGCRRHAEFNVLKGIKNGSKGKLYVYREKMHGQGIGCAAPCAICRDLIISKGIKTVYYTTDTGYVKEKFY